MHFGDAIAALKSGKTATRKSWTEGARIEIFKEGEADMIGWSSDAHPQQVFHPCVPDMLAEDWEVA